MKDLNFWDFLFSSEIGGELLAIYILIICMIIIILYNEIYLFNKYNPKFQLFKKWIKGFKIKKEKIIKYSILHYIQTDKAKYNIFNVEYDDSCVVIRIERNNKSILENDILYECLGMSIGQSFDHTVYNCICELKNFIKKQNEIIILDKQL